MSPKADAALTNKFQTSSSNTMAKQPIVKTSNTTVARKDAVKERRKAGKEALRAAREKDLANAANNAAKNREKWERSKDAEKITTGLEKCGRKSKKGKGARKGQANVDALEHSADNATPAFVMEQVERESYQSITKDLLRKRTPSQDIVVKGLTGFVPLSIDKTEHPHESSQNTEQKQVTECSDNQGTAVVQVIPPEEIRSRDVMARENIQRMADKVAEALAAETTAFEGLTKHSVHTEVVLRQSSSFDWADDVEANLFGKFEVDEQAVKIGEEASGDSEDKSEPDSSPESSTDSTSAETSILSKDVVEKENVPITETIHDEEKSKSPTFGSNKIAVGEERVEISNRPDIEAESSSQLVSRGPMIAAKCFPLPGTAAWINDATISINVENPFSVQEFSIKRQNSSNTRDSEPTLKAEEGKAIGDEEFAARILNVSRDQATLNVNKPTFQESKDEPRCGDRCLDIMSAANAHQYCCASGYPVNNIGPLGRPNNDIIVPVVSPEHLDDEVVPAGAEFSNERPNMRASMEGDEPETMNNVKVEPDEIAHLEDVPAYGGSEETQHPVASPLLPENQSVDQCLNEAGTATQKLSESRQSVSAAERPNNEDSPATIIKCEDTLENATLHHSEPLVSTTDQVHQEQILLERRDKERQLAALMAELGWEVVMRGDDDVATYMGLRQRKVLE